MKFCNLYTYFLIFYAKKKMTYARAYKGPITKKRYNRYPKKTMSRAKVYGAAGNQLWKDVKMLKNLINVEFKSHDVYGQTNINNTGTLVLLNGLSNGDDYDDRDGRQVRFKSLQLNTRCLLDSVSATNTLFRMIIFIDKQPNAGAPAVTELLDLTSAPRTDAHRNLDNRKRYVILKDKRFCVNQIVPEKIVDVYKKIDMKTIYDDSSTSTINDITSNSFYVYFVSDQAVNTPQVTYNARLRFVDN